MWYIYLFIFICETEERLVDLCRCTSNSTGRSAVHGPHFEDSIFEDSLL